MAEGDSGWSESCWKVSTTGIISKSWVDFSDYLAGNPHQCLAWDDIMQCKDSNGDGLMAGG